MDANSETRVVSVVSPTIYVLYFAWKGPLCILLKPISVFTPETFFSQISSLWCRQKEKKTASDCFQNQRQAAK